MNILSLLEKFLNHDENGIIVNSDYCVRIKSPMASCYECINRCPELAIEISDSFIKILDKCSNCKVCFNICPNYVFDIKNGLNIDDLALVKGDNVYYFCCKYDDNVSGNENIKRGADKLFNKNDNSYDDNIDNIINKLSCINEIDDVDIISHLKNNKNIFFITGDCKSCKNIYFYNSKIKKIDKISGFFQKGGKINQINSNDFDSSILNEKNIDDKQKDIEDDVNAGLNTKCELHADRDKGGSSPIAKSANELFNAAFMAAHVSPSEKDVERRLFFKNIGKTIKRYATNIVKEFPIEELPIIELVLQGSEKDNKKINKLFYKKRKKLFSFLKTNEDCLAILEIKLPKFNKNCVFCGNCWEFCPTGALRYKNNNIVLEPYLCTACNLCKDLCSFGAISMRKVKCLKDISYEKIVLTKQAGWENN